MRAVTIVTTIIVDDTIISPDDVDCLVTEALSKELADEPGVYHCSGHYEGDREWVEE